MTPSVRPDNRFRFHCSVIGRDERYLACVLRRHRKWRGEPIDCGGCAAAMDANKCPAVHMINLESNQPGGARAIFFDAVGEKLYAVPKPVAQRIERVAILPFHARRYAMTPELYERLTGFAGEASGGSVGEGAALAQGNAIAPATPARGEVRRKTGKGTGPSRERDLSGILENAEVDMAAAISAAAD